MTDAIATREGFTRAIVASSDEYDLFLLVKPETDFDGAFKAWDTDCQEFIRVNGWLQLYPRGSLTSLNPQGDTMKLLTYPEANPKLAKGLKRGVMTFALHLAPADLSGNEVCPRRTPGCTAACLNTAGRGAFNSVQTARIARTQWYFSDRRIFMQQLVREVGRAILYAEKRGYDAAFRLNATSDIPWERVPVDGFGNIFERFLTAQFYDYTKVRNRMIERLLYLPANYHLTFSLAENNAIDACAVLQHGGNVAMVFRTPLMAQKAIASGVRLNGKIYHAIDGDETDLRYLDQKGCIVALYAKGKAKNDASGFVHNVC